MHQPVVEYPAIELDPRRTIRTNNNATEMAKPIFANSSLGRRKIRISEVEDRLQFALVRSAMFRRNSPL